MIFCADFVYTHSICNSKYFKNTTEKNDNETLT